MLVLCSLDPSYHFASHSKTPLRFQMRCISLADGRAQSLDIFCVSAMLYNVQMFYILSV